MTKVLSPSGLFSVMPQKRFSRPFGYGLAIYGFAGYGCDSVGIAFEPYGIAVYGSTEYGAYFLLSGIYQMRNCSEGKIAIRLGFYNYVVTRTLSQQVGRVAFAAAVAGWQSLTEDQKNVYRDRAKWLRLSGYNLYLSEFLLSD